VHGPCRPSPRALARILGVAIVAIAMTVAHRPARAFPNLVLVERTGSSGQIVAMTTGRSGGTWRLTRQIYGQSFVQGFLASGVGYTSFSIGGLDPLGVACYGDSEIAVVGSPDQQNLSTCKTYRVLPSGQTQLNSFTVADDPAGSTPAVAVAFGPDSLLYVLCQSARVIVYDPKTATRLHTLDAGNAGANGNIASSIAIDRDGVIAVSVDQIYESSDAYRIHRMNPQGGMINEIAVPNLASRIACDLSGDLFCVFTEPSYAQDHLRVYRPTGSLELEQTLASPSALAFTAITTDWRCGVSIAVDSTSNYTLRRFLSDQDGDGLCDSWELHGLQAGEGHGQWTLPDNPHFNHKDVYVQIGAMQGFSPNPQAIGDVHDALQLAPCQLLNPPNPDGDNGVDLHVTYGDTTLTPMLLKVPFWAPYDSLKALAFTTSAERSSYGPKFQQTKEHVFRFCLFADELQSGSGDQKAGKSKSIQCRDFIVALGPAEYFRDQITRGGTRNEQASVFMHELGHTLGLLHGGGDLNELKPNYRSVMSYIWEMPNARVEPYWRLTYSQHPSNTINKAAANEALGIGGDAGDQVFITYQKPDGSEGQAVIPESGAADFNQRNGIETTAFAPFLDAPVHQQHSTNILVPYADWPRVNLSPFKNDVDNSDLNDATFDELSFAEHSLLFPPDGRPACDCNHNGRADWRDIQTGSSLDANGNGVPDECDRPRATVDKTLLFASPSGYAGGLTVTADIADLCAYDTASVNSPVIAVRHDLPGGNLILWGDYGAPTDTLVSYVHSVDAWYFGPSRWSGHGSVYFDVFAGPLYLGRTPNVEVRSRDLDPLVVGAVDTYDVDAVVAHYGQSGPAWYDLDDDGVIGPADSTLVADWVTDGIHRKLTSQLTPESYAVGDTIPFRWVAGQGDSARVTLLLERDAYPGEYEPILVDLPDNGHVDWVAYAADVPRSDYRVRLERTAGVRQPDRANAYDWDESYRPFEITGSVGVSSSLPRVFALHASRPNPARTSVTLPFDLPSPERVEIEVFDLQGRLVRNFAGPCGAGRHEWVWDLRRDNGSRIPPGMYLCRLKAGVHHGLRKMVVLP